MSGLLGDVGYIRQFSGSPSVIATMVMLGLLVLAVVVLAPRRRTLLLLTGASLAVVLGVTMVPWGGWRNFGLTTNALDSITRNVRPERADLTAWAHAGDGPLNVILFVPLGFFLALLLRRPITAALACVVLSVGIECYQSSLTTRVGDFTDVVANGLGAAAGAVLATLVLLVWRPGSRPPAPPARRTPVTTGGRY
ncbi:MAG TPA: VanZ family protein [Mycobacteriales bacterium]